MDLLMNNTLSSNQLALKPEAWQTWGVGMVIVTISAFASPLCILFVPLLNKKLYELVMTFLVALGIGALSGSVIFIMLPHAFEVPEGEGLLKSLIVLGSLYAFFAVDRILKFAMEIKRRQKSRRISESNEKNNTNSANAIPKLKSRENSHTKDEIEQIQAEIESAAVNSAITRTISEGDTISVSVAVVEQMEVRPEALEISSIAYMILFGSSANNFVDGMSNGVAFADSLGRGLSIGIACIAQQFPQELGTLAILVRSGLGFKKTLLLNLIPGGLSYLGFVIGALLDDYSEGADTFVFAISSGMYLYVFLGTLIPEMREATSELITNNFNESIIVTILQSAGLLFGLSFIYFIEFKEALKFAENQNRCPHRKSVLAKY
uniref:ZIP Zinc transporter n=1 Tax=Setaria digitata TaxID=48799 RepID=A0A915PVQ8_9BILA